MESFDYKLVSSFESNLLRDTVEEILMRKRYIDGEFHHSHEFKHSFHKVKKLRNRVINIVSDIVERGEKNFLIYSGPLKNGGYFLDYLDLRELIYEGLAVSQSIKFDFLNQIDFEFEKKLLDLGMIRTEESSGLENFDKTYREIFEPLIKEVIKNVGDPFVVLSRQDLYGNTCKIISYRH